MSEIMSIINIVDAVKYNRGLPGQVKAWEYLEKTLPDDLREQFAKLYRDNPARVAPTGPVYLYLDVVPDSFDQFGLRVLRLSLYNGDRLVDKMAVCSGQSSAQDLVHPALDYSGSMRICPEGIYDIGPKDDIGYDPGDAIGRYVYAITDRNPTNNRSALLFHADNNRARSPGSAGCICPYDTNNMFRLIGWLESNARPEYLIVNLGQGFLAEKNIIVPHLQKK